VNEPLKEIVRNISTQRLSLGGITYAGLVFCVLIVVLRATRRVVPINQVATQR